MMKRDSNRHPALPRNLILPRTELIYLPVTPEVARAVEQAVQTTLTGAVPASVPPVRRSAAGRAILHASGVSLPGVQGMRSRVCRRGSPEETALRMSKEAVSVGQKPDEGRTVAAPEIPPEMPQQREMPSGTPDGAVQMVVNQPILRSREKNGLA